MKQVKYICCFCEFPTKLRESEKDQKKKNIRFWNGYIVYHFLPEEKLRLALYILFLIVTYKTKLESFFSLGGGGGVGELLTCTLATIGSVGLKEIIERDKRQIIQTSLCSRQNLKLVSKICLAAPISLFWVPCGLNDRVTRNAFQISHQFDWKINKCIFNRQIIAHV